MAIEDIYNKFGKKRRALACFILEDKIMESHNKFGVPQFLKWVIRGTPPDNYIFILRSDYNSSHYPSHILEHYPLNNTFDLDYLKFEFEKIMDWLEENEVIVKKHPYEKSLINSFIFSFFYKTFYVDWEKVKKLQYILRHPEKFENFEEELLPNFFMKKNGDVFWHGKKIASLKQDSQSYNYIKLLQEANGEPVGIRHVASIAKRDGNGEEIAITIRHNLKKKLCQKMSENNFESLFISDKREHCLKKI